MPADKSANFLIRRRVPEEEDLMTQNQVAGEEERMKVKEEQLK